jgi:serine/threonine protein kinase
MEELIGTLLQERYRIESLLGRQTGRRTFLAIDTQTNNFVVVKILLFGPDFTWDDLKLFEREAEVLKSLNHPAIPKYLDSFEVELQRGQGFVLVQSHIAAQSLQQWIHAGRTFSEDDLQAIAIDLLKILEYLHNRQPAVIHRDIKPSNILLTDRTAHSPGQVYLIDFGSVQTAIKSGTRTIVGTYGYMPPEQFGGITSAASDIYALGVTIIYLATGCQPDELPQKDLQLSFEPQVNLSPGLVCWLQGAIDPRLEKRWSSTQQALKGLQTDSQLNISVFNTNDLSNRSHNSRQTILPGLFFESNALKKSSFFRSLYQTLLKNRANKKNRIKTSLSRPLAIAAGVFAFGYFALYRLPILTVFTVSVPFMAFGLFVMCLFDAIFKLGNKR